MDSNINLISNEILDLIHYKIIENIRCIIKNKNHSNIIIYGSEGCGKTTIIKNLFIHLQLKLQCAAWKQIQQWQLRIIKEKFMVFNFILIAF